MTSDKQLLANRRNAQLSTGPKTDEGKKTSSLNAVRHALTGQINVLSPEEREIHDEFCAQLAESLRPESAIENQLAHAVAEDTWRLNRARTIESNIFALASAYQADYVDTENAAVDSALSDARAFIADPHRFQLLTIYEQRIHRTMQKNLNQLQDLQATRRQADSERMARRELALEEARLFLQMSEIKGIPYDPAPDFPAGNGFVFSNAEIAASIDRLNRLADARSAVERGWIASTAPGSPVSRMQEPRPRKRAA